jgi:hypothetical protein
MAVFGFYEVFWPWRKKQRPKASLTRWSSRLILFCSISTLVTILILVSYSSARQNPDTGASVHPLYLYNGEVVALDWLRTNTKPEENVLAGPIDGNYIPARAGNHVFYGHELETIQINQKSQLLKQFFQAATTSDFRIQLIQQYKLRYLYYGVEEKHLLGAETAFDPALAGWPVLFKNEWVTIYKLS